METLQKLFMSIVGGLLIDGVDIWLLSPPNLILGDILRTLAFSEFFFDKKKALDRAKSHFGFTMLNHFFTSLIIDQNAPKKV